jgi:hypothetical protein
MTEEIITALSIPTPLPDGEQGEAAKSRGPHQDKAIQFAKDFRVGSELTAEDFDAWAHNLGFLNVPMMAPKGSDAWKAHLQRRHELRHKINNAATHPRMLAVGLAPFTIEAISQGRWEILTPHAAIIRDRLPRKVQGIIAQGKRKLRYLRESIDYPSLPPETRFLTESIDSSIDDFAGEVDYKATLIQKRITQLEQRVRKAKEIGLFNPTNGGVAAFLESHISAEEPQIDVSPAA